MASSTPGSSSAPVGHASMQRVHEPQPARIGGRRLELRRGHERAEHDPRAVPLGDQHRVLAVEADARAGGGLAVDVLVRVDEHSERGAERAAERVELLAQLGVAVVPGVARQPPRGPTGRGRLRAPVTERRRDDAAGAVEQALGMARDLGLRRREAQARRRARAPAARGCARSVLSYGSARVTPTASRPSSAPSRCTSAVVIGLILSTRIGP